MNREEFANKWAAVEIYEDGLPISIVIQARYNDLLADLDSLSLPPAEGAENIRQLLLGWEHYKRDHFRESEALDVEAILMSEYSQIAAQQQPPTEGAEQRIRVRNILQDFYRRGEYELEQAEEDIMRLFQPQPTARGAETIKQALCDDIEKSLNSAKMMHILSEDGEAYPFVDFMSTGDTIAEGREEIENIVEQIYFDMDSWPSLASLHAQRIADKMVEGELRKFIKWYNSGYEQARAPHLIVKEYLKTREK